MIMGTKLINCFRQHTRFYSKTSPKLHQNPVILGIESSCDDTGCAIITGDGQILGERLASQRDVVLRNGGVIPLVTRDLHLCHIEKVVTEALSDAQLSTQNLDAIAVTIKPGMIFSLMVGLNYAKQMCQIARKPLIPIHHMEAHALTIRLLKKDLEFPFLTFLMSGGHCLLAVVHSVTKYSLLGQCVDDAPGEILDKVSRRLKVHNLPKYRNCSGGEAVEDLAENGNPLAFEFTMPLMHQKNCNFSFSGMKTRAMRYISQEEKKFEVEPDEVIPTVNDFCASFQWAITKHMCWRLQRAMEFIQIKKLLPENPTLVVSGGVACNKYVHKALELICNEMLYKLEVPPPKYCTDNGIMIAWNGIEKYNQNIDIVDHKDLDNIRGDPKSPLGDNLTSVVEAENIRCKWIKIIDKLHDTSQKDIKIV